MKLYIGTVDAPGEWQVSVKDPATGTEDPLIHLVMNSPDGFSWGYAGSGPTDLAYCILADATGQEPPRGAVIRYRNQILAPLDKDAGFVISQSSVLSWWRNNVDQGD